MPQRAADRNLLFGIQALQNDFITKDALIAAMNAWVLEKHRPLGEILVEREALGPADRDLLDRLVDRHVDRHGGDPAASLAALSSTDGVVSELRRSIPGLDPAAPPGGDGPEETREFASDPDRTADTRETDPDATPRVELVRSNAEAGRYRKLRHHARGGLGVVFVALDEELNREVALKEIQGRHADNPASRARFLVEAEVTGGLEHPGIVPVYGLGSYDDGRPYYAMRFIKGDSLKEAIGRFHALHGAGGDPRGRELALRKLLRRFLDVCNAIGYAHSRGILHRDLKPDNVMVGKHGETLVVDWGLAKAVGRAGDGADDPTEVSLRPSTASGSEGTMPGSVVGTPSYMSPEQAAGRIDLLGPASDVYSLGATLYSLLTGVPPYSGIDALDVLRQVEAGSFSPPRARSPWVARALEAVCVKAMAHAPGERYPSPVALADDVERWLADEPVSAFEEPWPVRIARWGRRHRTLVVGASALLATAAVSLAISTALIGREQARTGRQRDLAELRLDQARRAVDDLLTRVAESPQLALPGLQPLRRQLLGRAIRHYEDFLAQERERTIDVRPSLADAYDRVARIDELIGDRDGSLAAARQALELREGLAREGRGDLRAQLALVGTINRLGSIERETGRPDEASAAFERARTLAESLLKAHPGEAAASAALAGTYLELAEGHHVAGRLAEALEACRQALPHGDAAAKLPEFAAVARNHRAQAHRLIGFLQAEGRDVDAALLSLARARELWEAAVLDDPSARRELADLDHRVGALLHVQGRLDEAMASYRRALSEREAMVAENSVAIHLADLAKDYDDIAELKRQTRRLDDSMRDNVRALDLREMLARQHATVTEYRRDVADSRNAIGRIHRLQGRFPDALKEHELALPIVRKLVDADPTSPGARADLASTLEAIGAAVKLSDPGRAMKVLDDALIIREALSREHPDDPQLKATLANSYNTLGASWLDRGRPTEAVEAAARARQARIELVAGHPDDHEARSLLAVTTQNLGLFLEKAGRIPEAESALVEAVAEQRRATGRAPEGPARIYRGRAGLHYAQLAKLRRAMGKPVEAASTAVEHAEFRPDEPEALLQAAGDLAACLPLFDALADRPEADRKAEADRCAGRALGLLRRSLEVGTVDPRSFDAPALAPLWARPESQPLREEIRRRAKSPR